MDFFISFISDCFLEVLGAEKFRGLLFLTKKGGQKRSKRNLPGRSGIYFSIKSITTV